MKAVMWSKPGCPYCVMAEELLNKKGYEIEERKIGFGWNREQLFEAVPNVKTVPQIFLDGAVPPQKAKIFESPDRGKTIYERDFGSTERRIVKTSVQQQWNITFNGMKV